MKSIYFYILLIALLAACDKEVSVSPPEQQPHEGVITVASDPVNVMIFLNGRNTGKLTPDSITFLDPGIFDITLKKQYYKDTSLQVTLAEDEKMNFYVDYYSNPSMYGRLQLTTEPEGATAYLNDSLLASTTPVLLTGLLPDFYNVRFELESHRTLETTATVRSSNTTTVSLALRDTSVWVDFQTYNSAISSNYITCINVDLQNKIWIGTDDSGLLSFDGGNFITYSKVNSAISSNKISCVLVDDLNNIWIGTDAGVNVFNGSSWQLYNRSNSILNSNNITSIKRRDNGDIYISTTTGIFAFDGVLWMDFSDLVNPFAYINDIEIDADGLIWVATSFYGIYQITETDSINYTELNSDIPTKLISSVTKSANGDKWFTHLTHATSRGGLSEFNGLTFQTHYIGSIGIAPKKIFVDSEDNKWVSTNEGIFMFTPALEVHQINRSNSLISSVNIRDITIDGNGTVWIATFGGGLNKYKIYNQ